MIKVNEAQNSSPERPELRAAEAADLPAHKCQDGQDVSGSTSDCNICAVVPDLQGWDGEDGNEFVFDLMDEVQQRMDAVVDAAVEWHQAGREGAEWFDKAEVLGAAIDSLLELRESPQTGGDKECVCGTVMDAAGCPNGH